MLRKLAKWTHIKNFVQIKFIVMYLNYCHEGIVLREEEKKNEPIHTDEHTSSLITGHVLFNTKT